MLLMSCRDASWNALAFGGNTVEGSVGVQILLCRQFELARAVRTGARPSQARSIENGLQPLLHEYFAKIPGIGFRNAPAMRCDICRLIDATKRVAHSDYAKEFAAFLAQTWDNEADRLSHDLAGVFRKYIDAVGMNAGGRNLEQMTRAVVVMEKVRELFLAGKADTLEPSSPREYLEDVADTMTALHKRIAAVGQPALRIVH